MGCIAENPMSMRVVVLETGDIRVVPEHYGQGLLRNKLAVKYEDYEDWKEANMPTVEKKDGSFQHVSAEEATRMIKNKEAVRSGAKSRKTTKEVEEAPANKMVEKPEKKKSK